MSIFELFLLVIAMLLLIISAVFSVLAASNIAKIDGYQNDPNLDRAHKWLTWASVISWIGIGILILLIIVYIYQNSESTGKGSSLSSNWAVRIFLFLILIILIVSGVLAANAAIDIQSSSNVVAARNSGAQKDAIISTILSLAGGGLVLMAFVYSLFNSGSAKEKEGEKKDDGKSKVEEAKKSITSNIGLTNSSKTLELEELLEKDPEIALI